MMYAIVGVILALGWLGTVRLTKENNNTWFLIVSGLVLLIFMGLRGDFTADYPNYILDFKWLEGITFTEVFRVTKEIVFALLMKITSLFTSYYQIHHFVMALLVCFPAFIAIRFQSKHYLLSVFFFLALTYYGESFNITRNCIAISILLLGYGALHKKQILRWVLLVLVATGFHSSALLFMPLFLIYFVPVTKRRVGLLALVMLLIVLFNKQLLVFAQERLGIYSVYTSFGTFEMLPKRMSLGNIGNILVRFSIYIAYFYLLFKNRNLITQDLYLAVISIAAFVLSFRIYLLYRFDLYLFGFFLLIFPNAFAQSNLNEKIKRILTWIIVTLCVLWVSFTFRGRYYPFWKNIGVYW